MIDLGGISLNDNYFFGCLLYLILASFVVGFLPSEFFTDVSQNTKDFTELTSDEDLVEPNLIDTLSYLNKLTTFLFLTFTIPDIPSIFSLCLLIINLFSIIICVTWTYDKIRGIGS